MHPGNYVMLGQDFAGAIRGACGWVSTVFDSPDGSLHCVVELDKRGPGKACRAGELRRVTLPASLLEECPIASENFDLAMLLAEARGLVEKLAPALELLDRLSTLAELAQDKRVAYLISVEQKNLLAFPRELEEHIKSSILARLGVH
jgi:hypothetical protein